MKYIRAMKLRQNHGFLTEKVNDGVLSLGQMSLTKLIELAQSCDNDLDRDTLGHEIVHRPRTEFIEIGLYLKGV